MEQEIATMLAMVFAVAYWAMDYKLPQVVALVLQRVGLLVAEWVPNLDVDKLDKLPSQAEVSEACRLALSGNCFPVGQVDNNCLADCLAVDCTVDRLAWSVRV